MKKNIAHIVSVLGHPLLTIPLYVALVMFGSEDFKRASLNTFLIIGCVFIPVTMWLYIKSRNGSYTNFYVTMLNIGMITTEIGFRFYHSDIEHRNIYTL